MKAISKIAIDRMQVNEEVEVTGLTIKDKNGNIWGVLPDQVELVDERSSKMEEKIDRLTDLVEKLMVIAKY